MLKPIALTCGDPSGIGPEIAAKAFAALQGEVPFFWIGDPSHLPEGTVFREIRTADEAALSDGRLPVMPLPFPVRPEPGNPAPENAAMVIKAIDIAAVHVATEAAGAICTAPINKKALKDGAGFAFPGHTEYLAYLAGVPDVVMMLACDGLRTVPVTIHNALAEVPARLTPDLLERTLRITHDALATDFAIARPRIAVAGLNPHAGEGGTMGREDIEVIAPVLARLRDRGMALTGPLPADTMFHAAARARYDAAVCMYHDQALIPIKTLDFAGGVNVTLGLPFIRTSPDHGTAYDIAGQDRADPASLIAALRMAAGLARNRAEA
ncbi:MAG: 4-hydroxythreonine-4-phosphate dehydrogenase PdxA [Rhodobacteraceae bacterium]|nr:4-hydroxythreonine-4-phosphate dehydrogenase PdxA [Paracoccaceae bacterium]